MEGSKQAWACPKKRVVGLQKVPVSSMILNKENIGWLGAFLILLGYYLNANLIASSWLVWGFGNALIGIYSLNKKVYPTAAMSFCLVIVNVYGYVMWIYEN